MKLQRKPSNTLSLLICFFVLSAVFFAAASVYANDWPQFRGKNRDGKSSETGLLSSWPQDGPPLAWKITGLGKGFSSISIASGKIFTMGDRKQTDNPEKEAQFMIAFDLATKKELWASRVGEPWGDGPRCTPTVDGDLVYAIGTHGDLVCMQVSDGKEVWRKNFSKDFGGKMMSGWGYSESPLIDGDKLLCTPGAKDAHIVALNKKTGDVIWKSAIPDIGKRGKDGAGYSSIVVSTAAGVRQYVQTTGRGTISVAAKDGKFLWGYNKVANNVANIPTPIINGDYAFCTTSYKTGSALLNLVADVNGVTAKEVYFLTPDQFENHHGGVVLVNGYIYGGDGQNKGTPVCLDFKTGKISWKEQPIGSGSAAVLYADNHLYFRYENNIMALVEATPKSFNLKGQFKIPVDAGPSWPYPVICDGLLYLRAGDTLLAYDIKTK